MIDITQILYHNTVEYRHVFGNYTRFVGRFSDFEV